MPRRTLRRAAADLFGPIEHFDGLPQTCLGPSNTSTGCRRLVWAHRTLRRAAAGLFGPIEHFDGLPQACLGPSNTSTGCRRLVEPHRTLRRAVAGLYGPIEHFDELPQACWASSNTSTGCCRFAYCRSVRLRIGFSALLLPPFIRCRPRRVLLHLGREKGIR